MLMSSAISLTFCSALFSWSVVVNFFFRSAFCSLVRFAVMISNHLSMVCRSTRCSTSLPS